jgi:hypothetical protein
MKFNAVSAIFVVPAALFSINAFAECSNIVLNMEDKASGREITTVLDCHDASYTIPGATTMHFMEWKSGKLCQSIQNCGNVSFWKGELSVGANWYWGNEVGKFKSETDSLSSSVKDLYESTYSSEYAAKNGLFGCFSANGSRTEEYTRFQKCDPRIVNVTDSFAMGVVQCGWYDEGVKDTEGYKQGNMVEYSNGKLSTQASSNSDWHTDGIHANFKLDFGQINRSCTKVQDFGCM